MLKIYKAVTRTLEDFVPLSSEYVKIYNCGPTVYDFFHIGNARNFITFDNIRRYLTYKGYKVRFIQNITDIDDKIITGQNRKESPFEEVSRKYSSYFFEYQAELNPPGNYHPCARKCPLKC